MSKHLLGAVLIAWMLCAGSARSEDFKPIGFRTPSLNIHCQLLMDDSGDVLRCDMREMSNRRSRIPHNCELDWGDAFAISTTSNKGQQICHGDTVMDDNLPVLSYGQAWESDRFTCLVVPSGLTCSNAIGHGFTLSRREQILF